MHTLHVCTHTPAYARMPFHAPVCPDAKTSVKKLYSDPCLDMMVPDGTCNWSGAFFLGFRPCGTMVPMVPDGEFSTLKVVADLLTDGADSDGQVQHPRMPACQQVLRATASLSACLDTITCRILLENR